MRSIALYPFQFPENCIDPLLETFPLLKQPAIFLPELLIFQFHAGIIIEQAGHPLLQFTNKLCIHIETFSRE